MEAVRQCRRAGRADCRNRGAADEVRLRSAEGGPTPEQVEKAARELHEIQERWKQVAEAPRAQAQALWHRYRQAADPIQAKAREFFAHRAEERARQPAAQAGAHRTRRGARRFDRLDQDRGRAEEAPGGVAADRRRCRVRTRKTTWKRFRDACDQFFTRRNADLRERKETWAANLAQKGSALRARRGAGRRRASGSAPAAEIRRLQADWKTIGPVRRNKSEAIWHRFRTACDTFFDRYKRRDEIELEAKQADREALVAELKALAPAAAAAEGERRRSAAAPPGDLLERVRSLRIALEPDDAGRPPGRGSAERPVRRRARAADRELPGRVPRHRARRRGQPAEDGEAVRARRRASSPTRASAAELVEGARRNAARGARGEHDRRARGRGDRSGGRWRTKCGRRRRR